ncbi:MAG: hypothetical protein J6S14_07820 [Clostridia bacterium]|nr:hypothetical protein [Clostridia bacterium]
MQYLSRERIQLGKTGWVLGDLPNLLSGALEVQICVCPKCRKLEFFLAENETLDDETPKKTCPECGTVHDFDYPKCPKCKHEYF